LVNFITFAAASSQQHQLQPTNLKLVDLSTPFPFPLKLIAGGASQKASSLFGFAVLSTEDVVAAAT